MKKWTADWSWGMLTTIQFGIPLVAATKERTPEARSQGNQGLSTVLSCFPWQEENGTKRQKI
jgi:hypothetical protein